LGWVYAWGSGRRGVLGCVNELDEATPKPINAFSELKADRPLRLCAGAVHSMALSAPREH